MAFDIAPEWGVIIGSAIGSLLLVILQIIKEWNVRPESKGYAITSIVLGLLFIIPFVCVPGLVFGIIAYRKTVWKKLALVGIVLCSILTAMYVLLLVDKLI